MAGPAGSKRDADHLKTQVADRKKPRTNGSITSFFGIPKTTVSVETIPSTRPSSNFDKQKWAASLTPEQKELLQLEIETLDESWLAQLKDEVVKPEFLALKRFLLKEKRAGVKIFPPEEEIYSWSRHTPLHRVKAVVIGQDPYHNHNQAHGLAFSVRPPTPAPPSLVNIYTGIKNDYPNFQRPPNKGGLLTPWAERGVLLLNTCLTVRAHQAASHSNKGWEQFTQKVIDLVTRVRTRGVVFLAWGTPAGKRVTGINREKHCVLQSVHPSPLSASRGFFTNQHFKKCNEWLSDRYGPDEIIDWSLSSENRTSNPLAHTQAPASNESNIQEDLAVKSTHHSKQQFNGLEPSIPAITADEFDEDLDALEILAAAESTT
ncbi:uracil-DNA glycosylase [Aspergillus saccharolyticus JOP 1030-1]|uniref:Uracil-DNA glycosylase n=1 Tax=Aspergillus saccharolyticus JOP 1030-1 TaxID=1450539 RepID=A0A319AMD6_9EURO|nr:putative uracil DNA N-glycosylase Ung1 [Aspergillus saccharolyticus JOP 1030-1]PYH47722.1 putative uracil DNA N-glycosylase Ung1 [Aspergillus saccharolyticus JOP 1030-1]